MTDGIHPELDHELRTSAETVQPLYEHHQWRWASVEGTPTVDDIYETLRRLVGNLDDDPDMTAIGTGRLTVRVVDVLNEGRRWTVSLDLASWEMTEK